MQLEGMRLPTLVCEGTNQFRLMQKVVGEKDKTLRRASSFRTVWEKINQDSDKRTPKTSTKRLNSLSQGSDECSHSAPTAMIGKWEAIPTWDCAIAGEMQPLDRLEDDAGALQLRLGE